jgi:hypothetical protein
VERYVYLLTVVSVNWLLSGYHLYHLSKNTLYFQFYATTCCSNFLFFSTCLS